ncbi:hypothetical protein CNR22_06410 [Sphingobacteriaceae bacterium]|nr:hypothetical protein CNR22_06410 [Sphingobacteriaceae bacterium]
MKQYFRKSVLALLVIFTASRPLNAQWTALPNPISAFTGSNFICTGQQTNPGYIRPLADGKIIYTSLCSSGSVHNGPYGYFMMSTDDLNSVQRGASVEESALAMSTSTSGTEYAWFSYYGGGTYFQYSPDAFVTTSGFAQNVIPAGMATAISPSYVYAVASATSAMVIRYNKVGGVSTTSFVSGFFPTYGMLHFINDSIGFTIAKFTSNTAKTTFIKIRNSGMTWQPLLIDSVNAIVNFQVSASGDLLVLKKNGQIYKSTDNGASFNAITSVPSGTYGCIQFANALTGFVGGENGTLLKTTNGGTSWTNETSNTTQAINAIYTYNYSSYFVDNANKIFISQQPLTSLEKIKNNEALSIYPNPATNELIVNYKTLNEKISLQILDVGGKLVFESELSGASSLDISGMEAGIYFVKCINSNHTLAVRKLVISR